MTFWPLSYISNLRIRQRDTRPIPAEVLAAAQATPHDLPGLHYVANFDDGSVFGYWDWLRVVQPKWITVLGAKDINEFGQGQSRNFAEGVAHDPIRTRVIWRHWRPVVGSSSDNGRMSVLTPQQWMTVCGKYYVGGPLYVMPDNEGFGLDYGKTFAQLINLAVNNGGPYLAVGAWPSHNPPVESYDDKKRPEWPSYVPMYERMYEFPGVAVAVPHIYYSRSPSVENLDGFRVVRDFFAYMHRAITGEEEQKTPIPFEVVISELGRCENKLGVALDANAGYSGETNGLDYAADLAALTRTSRWSWCVFSSGAWGNRGSFGVHSDYLGRMVKYATGQSAMPAPDAWLSEDGIMPIEDYQEIVAHLINGGTSLNVRKDTSTTAALVGVIHDGDTIGIQPAVTGADYGHGNQWTPVSLSDGKEGYAAAYWLSAVTPEPIPEPPPPAPPPTGEYVTPEQLQAALDAQAKAMRAEFGALVIDLVKIYGEGQLAAQERIAEFIGVAA